MVKIFRNGLHCEAMSPESSRLKALSAESLRSVSPGSDSVFYSEGGDHSAGASAAAAAATTGGEATGVLCHHCGREVDPPTALSGPEDADTVASNGTTSGASGTGGGTSSGGGGGAGGGGGGANGNSNGSGTTADIVQPPAGFADSPEGPRGMAKAVSATGSGGRLYKKLEKRFRSEERGAAGGAGGGGERRHHGRSRCEGVRAKSEERGKEDRVKLRPLARSTDASMEVLRAAASSPNVREATAGSAADLLTDQDQDEDDVAAAVALDRRCDASPLRPAFFFCIIIVSFFCCCFFLLSCFCLFSSLFLLLYFLSASFRSAVEGDGDGVYAESYRNATWIYIGDSEEMHVWQKPETKADEKDEKSAEEAVAAASGVGAGGGGGVIRRSSDESTNSEKDFKRKYQAITHRMVHRKSSVEMYKRLASKSFEEKREYNQCSLQDRLEEVLHLMMEINRRQRWGLRVRGSGDEECDKTVVVRRQSGEFGFRIHGSRPVVVSAIEPDTPAETSGLEVGDIVIAVNGVNVLDASHSEVVKIAHAGSDTLELQVARTCNVLTPVLREPGAGSALYSGVLWKEGGAPSSKWVRRWFCLKRDNCLYYYKTDAESQPLGALMLTGFGVERTLDSGRPHSFLLARPSSSSSASHLHLAADTEEGATRWLAVISHSIERNAQVDEWLDLSRRNLRLAPSAVHQPDCFGYLVQLGHRWKTWQRRYCVLKDACLYFYQDVGSDSAFGMACLHGYRVQNSTAGGKRFAFEILPPEPRQRHYYFHSDSEMDKKRWLAALEYSIDRWIKVG